MNLLTKSEIGLVKLYRRLHEGRLSPCRYVPSCSQYALDALETRGFLSANALIVRRLVRCAPWGGWGADPVPVKAK